MLFTTNYLTALLPSATQFSEEAVKSHAIDDDMHATFRSLVQHRIPRSIPRSFPRTANEAVNVSVTHLNFRAATLMVLLHQLAWASQMIAWWPEVLVGTWYVVFAVCQVLCMPIIAPFRSCAILPSTTTHITQIQAARPRSWSMTVYDCCSCTVSSHCGYAGKACRTFSLFTPRH